ncbi:MAG: carboxypeptidase-like regulatory domain-containing protein [Bacteroidota bacterium]
MKKNKISAFAMAALTASSLWLGSCKDDFSEEDLINAQQERADEQSAENIAVINGSNVTYRVNLHSNQEPQTGVSVSVTDQGTGEQTTATTDDSGNAVFADIPLGAKLVEVRSEGHANMSWVVDFGEPVQGRHYQMSNGNAFALEVAEFSKVEMLQTEGMQTATITGKVSIETDLTNDAPEVPQDLVLRANLDATVPSSHSSSSDGFGSSIYVSGSLTFTEGGVATATVDNTTGEYTLRVPATDEESPVEIILPMVEADQTLLHDHLNGVEVGPQLSTLPARFGPKVTAKATPDVPGTIAVFPEPPPPGRGVSFDFVGESTEMFGSSNILNGDVIELVNGSSVGNNAGFANVSNGEGYQSSPTLTVSAPDLTDVQGGVQAELSPVMRWELTSFTITDGGAGYNAIDNFNYAIRAFDAGNNELTLYSDEDLNFGGPLVGSIGAPVPSDVTGGLILDNYAIVIGNNGFEPNVVYTNEPVDRFELTITAPSDTPATNQLNYNGQLTHIELIEIGDGYRDNPTVNIEGGSPTTPASFELVTRRQWVLQVDNSTNTQPYVVPPANGYAPTFTAEIINAVSGLPSPSNLDNAEINENGVITDVNDADNLIQMSVENGNVVLPEGLVGNSWVTSESYEKPRLLFIEPQHKRAAAPITVNSDGEITDITYSDATTGRGYDAPFTMEVVSLSGTGSGVDFVLELGSGSNLGFRLASITLINGGSGYLGNNIDVQQSSTNIVLEDISSGQTYVRDINYGTGATLDDVLPPN